MLTCAFPDLKHVNSVFTKSIADKNDSNLLVISTTVDDMFRRFVLKASSTILPQKRYKYKQKWATNFKKKEPTDLALDYYDQYYQPVYGDIWPSVRLALLSPQKYCAIVNNFTLPEDIVTDLLCHGAIAMQKKVGDKYKVKGLNQNVRDNADSISDHELHKQSDNNATASSMGDNSDIYDFVPAQPVYSEYEKLTLEEKFTSIYNYKSTEGMNFTVLKDIHFDFPHYLKVHVFVRGDISSFPRPARDETGMFDYYLMDAASVLPVLCLDLQPGNTVLDLCAAPGGKSLVVLQTMLPDKLVCMDKSLSRLKRLSNVLHYYAPEFYFEERKVTIEHRDCTRLKSSEENSFDRVLVDAPCTTDRHTLLENDNNIFKPGRLRERIQITELQKKLLYNGIKSCKPGGTIVYSTCSLSPAQNDGVVHAALEYLWENTKTDIAIIDTTEMIQGLRHCFKFYATRFGYLVLPAIQANFGPMYFCKLKKLN